MPKQSPVADEFDKPFWDACNEDRLILQYDEDAKQFVHPPDPSVKNFSWKQINGTGTIYSYGVIYDTPIASLQADQPYNCAVIDLDEAPGINMMSHLPGTPPDEVPIGAKVELLFEVTPGNGQKVPEWRIV